MKETKPKQQVDDQAKQLTQESAALKNKERMYKMIGAPWPPRKKQTDQSISKFSPTLFLLEKPHPDSDKMYF